MESTPKKRKLENDLNLNTPSPKRSRWELMKEKYDLIQASEWIPKPTQKDLASMFGVDKTTVSDILKRKDEYKGIYQENTTSKRKRHDTGSKYEELNDLVYQWFKQARAKIPFTVPHWNTQWRRKWPGWHSVGTVDPCGSSRGRFKWTDFIWGNVWYRGVSECESDDEGDDVEMDKVTIRHTGSEYSHEDMLRNITHMINFANTKDDRYLKFLLPMQSMTEDTIVRQKMVKKQGNLICLSVKLLLLS